jgi:hypothetical protein
MKDPRVKRIIETAKKPWGIGWNNLGETLQRALVCQSIVDCIRAQDESTGNLPVSKTQALIEQVLAEAFPE